MVRLRRIRKALFILWIPAAVLSTAAASSDEALERAISLAAEERYAQARKVLDPLLARGAEHPRARLLDGILRARAGRVREAIEVFDRLRRDHPEMSEPWNNLAVLYAAEGRFDEARETLLAALERRPTAVGYANLGDIYGALARRAYLRARQLAAPGSAHPRPDGPNGAVLSRPQDSSRSPAPGGPSAEPGDASPPADSERSPAVQAACLRAGGFEDRRVLAGVEEWLESQGAEVFEVRRVPYRKRESHQVYLPPLEDREKAAATVRDIRARGVRGVAVIESGPLRNGISFGVFGVTEHMRRRVAALERLGYRVRSRDNWRVVHRYFVEARTKRGVDALRAAWTERFPERSLERVDCR